MANIGYARTSTRDQRLDLQVAALKAAGCAARDIYSDEGISGKLTNRPGLTQCLKRLRAGDTLIIWKLDRLGRSVCHLVETVNDLAERGIQFRSLTDGLDTSTPGGRLIFHVVAAVAEFERDLILERSTAGRRYKHERGGYAGYGSPPLGQRAEGGELVPDLAEAAAVRRIHQLREGGATIRTIVAALTLEGHKPKRGGQWHPETVRRVLTRAA